MKPGTCATSARKPVQIEARGTRCKRALAFQIPGSGVLTDAAGRLILEKRTDSSTIITIPGSGFKSKLGARAVSARWPSNDFLIAIDDVYGNKIPIWLFGFLY